MNTCKIVGFVLISFFRNFRYEGKKSFINVVRCANSCEKIYGSICVSISEVKGGATQTLGARRRITNEMKRIVCNGQCCSLPTRLDNSKD